MLIAKCLATLQPYKETYCSSYQQNIIFPTILHVHTDCFKSKVPIAVIWPETVRGCEQNLWFLYHQFGITNSFSWIKNEVVTSFLRIFMNSFTRTSFLFAKRWIYSYEFVRVFSMLRCEWPVLYIYRKVFALAFQNVKIIFIGVRSTKFITSHVPLLEIYLLSHFLRNCFKFSAGDYQWSRIWFQGQIFWNQTCISKCCGLK